MTIHPSPGSQCQFLQKITKFFPILAGLIVLSGGIHLVWAQRSESVPAQPHPRIAQAPSHGKAASADKSPQKRDTVEGELLVKFGNKVSRAATENAHAQVGASVVRKFDLIGWQHVRLPKGMTVAEGMASYQKQAGVLQAEPNYRYHTSTVPNDTSYSSLWGMTKISAPAAWDSTTGDSGTVVAVIDTGVSYTHPDLSNNMWRNPGETAGNGIDDDGNGYIDDIYGIDAVNNDSNPMDDYDHGTHCAGTIGAVGNNGVGVAGVNWNVRIMALKFLDYYGYGDTSDAITCLNYVVNMKARGVNIRVTNNSWGGGPFSQALKDAFDAAGNAGIVNVCAAGNDYSNNDTYASYPASFSSPSIISVAASDQNDNKASFSNYGVTSVDLAAPGVGILSTVPGSGYASNDGTSMAAPHVTGAVALLAGAQPSLAIADIKTLLQSTVDTLPQWSSLVAWGGRLNLARAVASVDASFVSVNNITLAEGNSGTTDAVFTVTLSRAGSDVLQVPYSTQDGSARAGSDYTATSGTLSFAAGETSKEVRVPVLGDTVYERSETFTLGVTGSANSPRATGTITNDDAAVSAGGRIVFSSYRDGNYEIYAMQADGSGLINLSRNAASDTEPALSRDGSRIVFVSTRDGNSEIYSMNADGSGQTRLTNTAWPEYAPSFSPNGSRIAYESAEYYSRIYTMNADGSNQLNLSGTRNYEYDPEWSPDGTKIIFASSDSYFGYSHLVLMNADGSRRVQLTFDDMSDDHPTFSPDGTQIAFQATDDYSYYSRIFVMNVDGSGIIGLSTSTSYDREPAFSLDGTQLCFTSSRTGDSEIYTVFIDGSLPTNITNSPGTDSSPAWGPSTPPGSSISGRVANAAGTGLRDTIVTRSNGTATASVYTNNNGEYTFLGVPAGSYTLTPGRADTTFTPATRSVTVSGAAATGQNFVGASPYSSIGGVVTNSKGRRMPNISLRCNETGATVLTDVVGSYKFSRLSAGTYTIAPVLTGYSITPGSIVETLNGDEVYDRNFVIKPLNDDFVNAQTLSGNVATANGSNVGATRETSEPYHVGYGASTSVWYQWVAPSNGRLVLDTANSNFDTLLAIYTGNSVGGLTLVTNGSNNDYNGLKTSRVAVNVIAGTTYRIAVDGSYPAEGNVALSLNFTAVPTPTIAGFTPTSAIVGSSVVITGSGFTDVTSVMFNNYAASFTINSATQITAIVPWCTVGPISISSPGGTAISSANFTMIPSYQVRGSVTRSTGAALSGFTVRLTGSTPADTKEVTTDSTGAYTFNGVVAGTYTLSVIRTGFTFEPAQRGVTVTNASVTGQNFTGAEVSVAISGRIATASGTPVANVSLTRTGSTTPVLSDANGNYSFEGVATGTYVITPARTGWLFSPASLTVNITTTGVANQNFTGAMTIGGRVTTTSGARVGGVSMALSGRSTPVLTNSTGYYTFTDVAAGTYTVTPTLSGFTFSPASRAVTVASDGVVVPTFVASGLFNIRGKVTNSSGVGLEGISIARSGSGTVAVTDAAGNYVFSGINPGTYSVSPVYYSTYYSPTTRAVTVTNADVTGQNFSLATMFTISGTVKNLAGTPIADVEVFIRTESGGTLYTLRTKADGSFMSGPMTPGTYRIQGTPPAGFIFSEYYRYITIADRDITGQNLVLSPARTISGRATAADGTPLTNTFVSCSPAYLNSSVRVDANGYFAFSPMPEGSYTLTSHNYDGYIMAPATRSVTLSGGDMTGQNFTGTPTFSVGGTIRTSAGMPLASINLQWTGGTDGTSTNASGNYTFFKKVPAGDYIVTPVSSNYTFSPPSATVTVTAANVTGIDFIATRIMSISGKVTNAAGSPLANVSVTRSGSSTPAITDINGNYKLSAIPAGTYAVTPTLAGYSFTPAMRSITLGTADSQWQDFTANPLVSLSGRIATADGAGVPGAIVTRSSSTGDRVSVTSDASGAYSFTGVTIGSYTLSVARSGYRFVVAGFTNPVNVTANQGNLDFTATALAAGTYSIRGRITNHSGVAMPGITVICTGVVNVTTSNNGEYVFPAVPSGSVVVAPLITPGLVGVSFAPAYPVLELTASRTNVNFQATFTISGRLSNHSGAGIPNVLVQRSAGGSVTGVYTDAQGNYSFSGVRSGSYTLAPVLTPAMNGMSFTPTALNVTVDRNNITNQNFIGMFTVSGRVANSAGAGIANIQVQRVAGGSAVSVFTDSNGTYSFSGVRSGSYVIAPVLTPAMAGMSFTPGTIYVAVDRNNIANQNFTGLFSISGRVTTSAGAGILDVVMRLNNGSGNVLGMTDSNGYYRFNNLLSGTYSVTPSITGRTFAPASRTGIVISSGSAASQNFTGSG